MESHVFISELYYNHTNKIMCVVLKVIIKDSITILVVYELLFVVVVFLRLRNKIYNIKKIKVKIVRQKIRRHKVVGHQPNTKLTKILVLSNII